VVDVGVCDHEMCNVLDFEVVFGQSRNQFLVCIRAGHSRVEEDGFGTIDEVRSHVPRGPVDGELDPMNSSRRPRVTVLLTHCTNCVASSG